MQKRSKYLLKNVFSFALGKAGTRLITFLMAPLYTYALSTGEFGTADLITTLSMVIMPVLSLNVGEAVMRFGLDKGADHRKVIRTGIGMLLLATVLGLAMVPILQCFEALKENAWLIYLYVITLAYSQVFLYYLRGQEKVTAYSVGNIIHTAVAAVLNVLFLVVFRWGLRGYLLAYICSNVSSAAYAAVVGRVDKAFKGFRIDRRLSIQMLRFSVVLVPNTFMWWIINSSDRLMVTAIVGAAANGIYAIAYKIPSLLSTMSEVFSQAWSYSAIREQGSRDETEYHNQMYHNMVVTLTFITASMLLIIRPFLRYYVAQDYYSAWMYTPYLFIGFLFQALGQFLATPYTVHKNSWGFLLSGTMGAVVNIVLNFLMIPRMGVAGAALATCLSYFSVYLFRAIHTQKYIKIRVFRIRHLLGYGLLLVMSVGMFINGWLGILLLIGAYALVLVLSKDFFLALLKKLKMRGKK